MTTRRVQLSISLFAAALLLSLTVAVGCSGSDRSHTPVAGDECDEEGQRDGDLVCEDGVWVFDEQLDAGGDDVDDGDASGDDTADDDATDDDAEQCEAESDEEFCARHEAECGELEALDNCDEQRTVDCEQFDGYGCEDPEVCVTDDEGDDPPNSCRCPTEQDHIDECEGQCTDLTEDVDHCSECGASCADELDDIEGTEPTCNEGQCELTCIDEDETYCPGQELCTNLEEDDDNCGQCGRQCLEGETCEEGQCPCEDTRQDFQVCLDQGVQCGETTDACGDTVNCGECETLGGGLSECCDGICCGPNTHCCDDQCIPSTQECDTVQL